MPFFGTGAMLTIWVAAIYALTELRRQPVTTTMHILVAAGLLVAAGIIEGLIASGPAERWTRAGLLQTLFLTTAALLVPFGFLLGLVGELMPFSGCSLRCG